MENRPCGMLTSTKAQMVRNGFLCAHTPSHIICLRQTPLVGIYIDIDISSCQFEEIPSLVLAIHQPLIAEQKTVFFSVAKHTVLSPTLHSLEPGQIAVFRSSATSVRAIMWDPARTVAALLSLAKSREWQVNWLGDTSTHRFVFRQRGRPFPLTLPILSQAVAAELHSKAEPAGSVTLRLGRFMPT